MQIFDSPHTVMLAVIGSFVLLVILAVLIAVKGLHVATGATSAAGVHLATIRAVERGFKKAGKQRAERCMMHVGVSFDSPRNLYFERKNIFKELKWLIAESFSLDDDSIVAPYDEKSFLVFGTWNDETARANAERCVESLNEYLAKQGVLSVVNVRIGFCCAVGSDVSFDEAIKRAKQAYTMTREQKVSVAAWSVSSGKALDKKIEIESRIESQIDGNRFFLEYQPVLDAKTKKIIGAEVLSRLNSENDGVLTPGMFLPAVDSVGINEKFDYYIFEKNCKWISNDRGRRESFKYTVNFSRSTLSEPTFAKTIIGIAEKYELKLSCLAVEVLEDKNVSEEEKERMNKNLAVLKECGVSILLDDFGSGYAALGDLHDLDISIVKIDKDLTWKAVTEKGYAILENIVRTAHAIGLKVLCEGIESAEQEAAVIRADCDFLQGFYYYKPMSVSMLEKLFEEN